MYGKPTMTCFDYQMYLYGYHHYLNAILWMFTELVALWVIKLSPPPTAGSRPFPFCMV